jgi:hypothetical protein
MGSDLLRGAPLRRCRRWHCGRRTDRMHKSCGSGHACGSFVAQAGTCGRRSLQPDRRPATGDFGNAKVIKKFGDVPDDLSAL